MSWNYRVVRFDDAVEGEYLEIKEVYYDNDGGLMGYCDATVGAGSIEGIIEVLEMMKTDAHKAIIDEKEFHKVNKAEEV